jgi:hypothetical protein
LRRDFVSFAQRCFCELNQADSTAQMLDWFKQPGREPGGLYQYYKTLAEKLPDPETAKPAPLSVSGYRAGRRV